MTKTKALTHCHGFNDTDFARCTKKAEFFELYHSKKEKTVYLFCSFECYKRNSENINKLVLTYKKEEFEYLRDAFNGLRQAIDFANIHSKKPPFLASFDFWSKAMKAAKDAFPDAKREHEIAEEFARLTRVNAAFVKRDDDSLNGLS